MAGEEVKSMDLSQLRNLVRMYVDNHLYKSAEFWADKVCSLSKNNVQDVLWFANTLFLTKQYLRAVHLLKSNDLILSNAVAKYLAAKCYYECREYRLALQVLEGDNSELKIAKTNSSIIPVIHNDSISCDPADGTTTSPFHFSSNALGGRKIESSTALLHGMVFEALENKELAVQYYKDALQHDIYCFEAYDLLVSHNALANSEENQLLQTLPFNQQCNESEADFVKFVYGLKINKYSKPSEEDIIPVHLELLCNNLEYVVCLAERHFNNCNYTEAYKYTSMVLQDDPLHESCLPLHISCLVELKMKNDLYNTAHRLVNTYPTRPVSWYAIGAYYLLIKRNEAARKYFSKATTIDSSFGPAWLGFAHSFAAEGEHDQAISAYYSAAKYMPGSHLPFLYLGLQYSLSNNIKLASKFFKEALLISGDDPQIKHELGNLAFQSGEYEEAENYFLEALHRLEDVEQNISSTFWEPLYNNLGHVSRKLKKYDDALNYHQKALQLNPRNSGTYSSIGFLLLLQGEFDKAIPKFHQALSLKRDDFTTIQLLNQALECSIAKSTEEDSSKTQHGEIVDSDSVIDLSCNSKSLPLLTTSKSDVDSSMMEMEDSSRMSMEMSDISS